MNQRSAGLFLSMLLCLAPGLSAETPGAGLRLPELKEVNLYDGGFRLNAETKIFVELGHQSEDRIAAETLVDQIADQSGFRLNIMGAKPGSKGKRSIVLARLGDPGMREFLASKGLNADASVGDQGYLLFSDKHHLIVAANTGQGLFSGVQTLRQLLRPEGKYLVCPALAIRDWPTLQWQHRPEIAEQRM
jgi:hexosaminidase